MPLAYVETGDGFWLVIWAASATVALGFILAWSAPALRRRKQLTWDMHTEYIDTAEFSNRNIPLKIIYKGSEPRWLWATYFMLRNSGKLDITAADLPERHHLAVGAEDCRYIGFNKLISRKAKVSLNPLFRGESVFCKIEFDRLGPGDEILASLLYVADDKLRVQLEGELFGSENRILSGYEQRMRSWRGLWWLLLSVILVGSVAAVLFSLQFAEQRPILMYQMQILAVIYFLALLTAGILLRPIRYWQQIPELFGDYPPRTERIKRLVSFLFAMRDEP